MLLESTVIFATMTAILTGLATTATLTWWLSRQFAHAYQHASKIEDVILNKIIEHEKLDMERFANLELRILELRMLSPLPVIGKPK